MEYVPRQHQISAVEAIRASVARGNRRVLAVGPTGCGKMYVAAMIVKAALEKMKCAVFMADQRELVWQCEVELARCGVTCDKLMAGVKSYYASPAMLVSKDTLISRFKRGRITDFPPADVLLVDEAHRSLADTWKLVASKYPGAVIVGFTATPCRTDGRGMGESYDDMVVMATYKELQDAKLLVPVRLYGPSEPDLEGVRIVRKKDKETGERSGEYSLSQVEERMDKPELVGNIVQDWLRYAPGRSTIVFASGVNHSVHIRDEFRRAGFRAEHLDGKTPTPNRDDIFAGMREGRIQVLCNFGIATTGVDVPALKCAVIARPTKSFLLFRQMCGRIQRPFGGYEDAIVIDHGGCWRHHGFPDEDVEWSLNAEGTVRERTDRARKERDRQSENNDPLACTNCPCIFRGPVCPVCGHVRTRSPKRVEMTPGELREIERARARKEATVEDKQKAWDGFLRWAAFSDRRVGAASGRFKDRFGVWPNRVNGLLRVASAAHVKMPAREFYDRYYQPTVRT